MALLSRTKGRAFEQEVARDLRRAFPAATVHRSSQADRAFASDVVVDGDAPVLAKRCWFECQTAAAPNPLEKIAQAERDLAALGGDALRTWGELPNLPVVVWRRKASRTVNATMRLSTLTLLAHHRPVCRGDSLDGVVVTVHWVVLLDMLRADAPKLGGA